MAKDIFNKFRNALSIASVVGLLLAGFNFNSLFLIGLMQAAFFGTAYSVDKDRTSLVSLIAWGLVMIIGAVGIFLGLGDA